jgi:hypothetical protein
MARSGDGRPVRFGAVVLGMVAVAFVASNPFLYHDPVGRTWLMFQNRRDEMAVQMSTEPHRAVLSAQDRLYQTLDRSLYNEAWGPSHLGYPIEAGLGILGFGWLLSRAVRRRPGVDALLVLLSISIFGGIAWGLGYRQQHYFIPGSIMGLVLAGLGVGFTLQWVVPRAVAWARAIGGRLSGRLAPSATPPAAATVPSQAVHPLAAER